VKRHIHIVINLASSDTTCTLSTKIKLYCVKYDGKKEKKMLYVRVKGSLNNMFIVKCDQISKKTESENLWTKENQNSKAWIYSNAAEIS